MFLCVVFLIFFCTLYSFAQCPRLYRVLDPCYLCSCLFGGVPCMYSVLHALYFFAYPTKYHPQQTSPFPASLSPYVVHWAGLQALLPFFCFGERRANEGPSPVTCALCALRALRVLCVMLCNSLWALRSIYIRFMHTVQHPFVFLCFRCSGRFLWWAGA